MRPLSVSLLFFISTSAFCGEWYPFTTDYKPIRGKSYFDEEVVENRLWQYVKVVFNGEFKDRDSYDYQYMVLENYRFEIHAYCHLGWDLNPSEQFLAVDDGGSCYFQVEYNSSTGVFSNLYVNGNA